MTSIAHSRKLVAMACGCAIAVVAAPALSAPPNPPARPAGLGKSKSEKTPAEKKPAEKSPAGNGPLPSGGGVAPVQGSGAAKEAPNGGRQPVDVDVQSLQPYNLPPASRAKMRACGEEWRALKLAGQASGLTWRSFAEKCLVK